MAYAPEKFEAAMPNGLGGNTFTRSIVLYIMLPMYLQSLKLLRPMVKEMHYQKKKTLFDLDPKVKRVKITLNVAQYPRLHATYVPAKFDVVTSHG